MNWQEYGALYARFCCERKAKYRRLGGRATIDVRRTLEEHRAGRRVTPGPRPRAGQSILLILINSADLPKPQAPRSVSELALSFLVLQMTVTAVFRAGRASIALARPSPLLKPFQDHRHPRSATILPLTQLACCESGWRRDEEGFAARASAHRGCCLRLVQADGRTSRVLVTSKPSSERGQNCAP